MEREKELLALLDDVAAFERAQRLNDSFNLFEAVGMSHQEIRHSRFLGFLLDPSSAHGLGDKFLRAMIGAAIAEQDVPPMSRLELALADCSDAMIYLERDHFDLTVHLPKSNLLFVIENKVRAGEREDQLSNYRERVEQRYQTHRFLGIFLTPDGDSGEDGSWACVSYRAVSDILRSIHDDEACFLPAATRLLIAHYIDLVGKHVVVSPELIEACRKIYGQHRAAFDLIMEHGQVPVLSEAFDRFCAQVPGVQRCGRARTERVTFISTSWLLPTGFQVATEGRWESSCPPLFWFRLSGTKLQLRVEVGPVANPTFQRRQFIEELRKVLNVPTGRITDTYTRISLRSATVKDDLDIEEIAEKMAELWTAIRGPETIAQIDQLAKKYAV